MSILKVSKTLVPLVRYMSKSYFSHFKLGHLPLTQRNKYINLWSKATLENLNVEVQRFGAPISKTPSLLVGNHISYLDIPLLMSQKPCTFVAKSEIAKWPMLGQACRIVGVVFVHRNKFKQNQGFMDVISQKILKQHETIAIFPSGTTSIDENVPWKKGAFRAAQEHRIPVQPFRLFYEPARIAAYIDNDVLVPHMAKLLDSQQKIKAIIEFGEVVYIDNINDQMHEIQKWCQEANQLSQQKVFF